jgi:hypothetical protein
MKKLKTLRSAAWIALIFLLLLAIPTAAQEGGLKEDFENAALEGWEFSPEVTVVDGALRLSDGQIAFRHESWEEFSLQLRVRASSPGDMMVHYYAAESSRYVLHIFPEEIILERVSADTPELLGATGTEAIETDTWIDLVIQINAGEHLISIDDQEVIRVSDPDPLSAGSVGLMFGGVGFAEFDDLVLVRGISGEVGGEPEAQLPIEGEPEGDAPMEGEPEEPVPQENEPGAPGEPEDPQSGEPETPDAEPAAVQSAEDGGSSGLISSLLSGQAQPVELQTFTINLLLSALFAFILGRVYVYWGTSLSNRRSLAGNFMLITITTTFIILVVRSSVALSLGLVGALSIVRFRAAIKEPEELAYLFFAIGIGIGLGDNQRIITLVALVIGILLMGVVRLLHSRQADKNLHITIASGNPEAASLEQVMDVLDSTTSKMKLLRFDETSSAFESTFLVEFANLEEMKQTRKQLLGLAPEIEITFMDNRGIE